MALGALWEDQRAISLRDSAPYLHHDRDTAHKLLFRVYLTVIHLSADLCKAGSAVRASRLPALIKS